MNGGGSAAGAESGGDRAAAAGSCVETTGKACFIAIGPTWVPPLLMLFLNALFLPTLPAGDGHP